MLCMCFLKNATGASIPRHKISDIETYFSGIIMTFNDN